MSTQLVSTGVQFPDATVQTTAAITPTSIPGNAATATKLATPRLINGVSFDGSADITIEGGGGGGGGVEVTTSIISESTLAVASTMYIIVNPLTLTLPANPVSGNIVYFSNRSNSKSVVIARNGQLIMGIAEDMTINVTQAMGSLVFADATRGWVLL